MRGGEKCASEGVPTCAGWGTVSQTCGPTLGNMKGAASGGAPPCCEIPTVLSQGFPCVCGPGGASCTVRRR